MQVTFIDDDVSRLNVFGNLNINSADLLLIFDQEFIPTLNTSFDVLTWSLTRTGTFDNILVDELLGDAITCRSVFQLCLRLCRSSWSTFCYHRS